jgi:hypothetical protein
MDELYRGAAAIMKRHGIASEFSKAGCVRCGACSCMALYEEH